MTRPDARAPAEARLGEPLPRRLGPWSGAMLLVGLTVGSGIFRVPAAIASEVGTVGAIATVWVVGGMIALAGALVLAELAVMFPRAGGMYVFLREAYGPLPAFLYGWMELLVLRPAALGALALIFAEYAGAFVRLGETGTRVLAASLILLLAGANLRSLGWANAIQGATAAAKAIALALLALLLFLLGDPGGGAFAPHAATTTFSWAGLGVALVAVLWAYDGWADATAMSGEVRDASRTLPRALLGGTAIVVVLYLLVNAAYLHVLPVAVMARSPLVASDAVVRVAGDSAARVIAALVMLSVFGALSAAIMTGPRILFALARDGLFFDRVASVHPRWRTPWVAIAVTGLLGAVYVSLRTFEQLAGAFVLGVWPFYALAVAAVIVLRRRTPDAPRAYRTPGYPLVPLAFLAASALLIASSLIEQPGLTLFGLAVIAGGVPIYFGWRAVRARSSRAGGTG